MNEKQEYLLRRKIADANLDVSKPFFIAGGALTSVFSGAAINDIDIFFNSVDEYRCLRGSIKEDPKIETESAVSYVLGKQRVQLVKRTYGSPLDTIKKFDFTVCKAAYAPNGGFVLDDLFLYDLASRTLRYCPGDYPIASLWRAGKYIKKGFTFPAVESIKLSLAINNLNLSTYADLKEQLEGIDTSFLKEITDGLLDKAAEVYDFTTALDLIEEMLKQKLDIDGGEL